MYILILTAALILLFLLLIRPSSKKRREAQTFCRHPFAHRGLHSREIPENTLSAFRRAREESVGIELDVRLTKDKEPIVFHDETLLRAAGMNTRISDITYAELKTIPLFNTKETIPHLAESIQEAGGTPLLIEIKAEFDCAEICEKTADLISGYPGEIAVESFSPLVLRWFAKNRPAVLRGQLSSRFKDPDAKAIPLWERILITSLITNIIAKPDFIAYDIRNKHQPAFLLCRKIFCTPYLYWTVKGGKKENCIFEN